MYPDEEITLDKINNVRKIKCREPCNSFEAESINNHKRLLNEMEEIVKCYLIIQYLREIEKTKA